MGKSTTAGLLARQGIAVTDTDAIARRLVEPGQPALAEIARAFGADLIDSEGRLLRPALAQIVFSSSAKREQLERILHPSIRRHWLAQVAEWRGNHIKLGVVVIPLLYETGAESHFDSVLCVASSFWTQQERLRARGWSEKQIQQRLTAQWPIEKKIAAAPHVVWTEGDMVIHERQLERVLGGYWSGTGRLK